MRGATGRRVTAVAAWAACTAAVTAVSWAGVHAVGSAVEGSPVALLSPEGVAHDVGTPPPPRGPGGPASTGASTTPTTSASTTAPGPGHTPITTPEHPTTPAPSTTSAPTTTASPGGVATFVDGGGQITVSCAGSEIFLSSATPGDGYQASVLRAGPGGVDVRFLGAPPVADLIATCGDGQPRQEAGTPPPGRAGPSPGPGGGPPPTGGSGSGAPPG